MNAVAEKAGSYLQDFTRIEKSLAGASLPWLAAMRSSAIARFAELGFPTQRDEAWRFTSIDPIAKTRFHRADVKPADPKPERIKQFSYESLKAFQLVFVNGWYSAALSSIPQTSQGVRAGGLGELLKTHGPDLERHLGRYADAQTQAFTALNAAFFSDGAHVYLPKGTVLETPIHLLFISLPDAQPAQSHPRVLIVAENDTQASVVETYAGPEGAVYFTNAVSEVILGDNACLDHYKIERESKAAFHVSTLQVQQGRDSGFTSHAVLLGGALVRNNIYVALASEGATCSLNGLYVIGGSQHSDTHTFIDHVKPHGTSQEYYKGVLDGKAHAVFDGKITVRPDAQKTDSMQSNKNLLLSDQAKIDTKPELKIFANDVKCKHGATIGQISAESLFYLRSRGIALDEARRLLIRAFASEIIQRVQIPALQEALTELCRI